MVVQRRLITLKWENEKVNRIKSLLLFVIVLILNACSIEQEKSANSDFSLMILSDVHISSDETKDNRLTDIITAININI